MARERTNLPIYRLRNAARAAQTHANVTITEVAPEIDLQEMIDKDRKVYRAQRGIARFLSMMRKKTKAETNDETLESQKRLTESKSENSLDFQTQIQQTSISTVHSTESPIYVEDNGSFGELRETMGTQRHESGGVESSSERRASNISAAWSENEELVNLESKQLNYGAFEPIENITTVTNTTHGANCFTIPVRSRNMVQIEPGNILDDSYTDFQFRDSDSIAENKIDRAISVPTSVWRGANETGYAQHIELSAGVGDSDPNMQAFDGAASDHRVKRHKSKMLSHSCSDQCISYNSKHSKISFKSMRSRNIVSPTDKITFNFAEENENPISNKKRTLSSTTSVVEHSFTVKKKKKKDSFLMKKSPGSMPDLPWKKEKF